MDNSELVSTTLTRSASKDTEQGALPKTRSASKDTEHQRSTRGGFFICVIDPLYSIQSGVDNSELVSSTTLTVMEESQDTENQKCDEVCLHIRSALP